MQTDPLNLREAIDKLISIAYEDGLDDQQIVDLLGQFCAEILDGKIGAYRGDPRRPQARWQNWHFN